MTDNPSLDDEASRRKYQAPYTHNHPIPTVQRYRQHRGELDERQKQAEHAQQSDEDDSQKKGTFNAVKRIFKDDEIEKAPGDPYPTTNRNTDEFDKGPGEHDSKLPGDPSVNVGQNRGAQDTDGRGGEHNIKNGKDSSATEKAAGVTDPKEKRRHMKKNERDDGGRVVTDPVTHLPLVIRDSTDKDLRRAPQNEPAPGLKQKTTTGTSGAAKSSNQLHDEQEGLQENYDGMKKVFPPPDYEDLKMELQRTYQLALTMVIGVVVMLATLVVLIVLVLDPKSFTFVESPKSSKMFGQLSWLNAHEDRKPIRVFIPLAITVTLASVVGFATLFGIRDWLGKKVHDIWEDEVWDAARSEEQDLNNSEGRLPESTAWMNGLLAAVWPLINPDLFASVADMLEDVMQASLPKVIRMVSVDDLGQGSEAIRILGIRSLPTGAANQSVDEKGNLEEDDDKDRNDHAAPEESEEKDNEDKVKSDEDSIDSKKQKQQDKQKEQEQQAIREGMEAEQGDFVNMELAFAYRSRSSGKSLKSKAKNAHLYLKFYLPGGIFVPVWVELRGMIGTMRMRLQLTPDPPFFSLCTLTFLGQPRADISCVPLSKHLPNLMNVPLISSFVQSSIDAALAEYVAPKSLTLDLKDMLVGDDFKKDTVARGMIVVFIKEARDFKEGDGGIGPVKGKSDAYVTCSWGKFGKTVSSTRIIEKDQKPSWHEWAYLLVTPEELNADEKLRLQLWDSDKYTADDDLGRVEVDLKELMQSEKTKDKMCDREDRFMGEEADERLPGHLIWSVGFYSKARITDEQLRNQKVVSDINNREDLKERVSEMVESKMREATAHDESKETNQQKVQDYAEQEKTLICASRPDSHYPSGILSIQIHNITGLEVESSHKRNANTGEREDEDEQAADLPSSYCTIILNHKKVFRTRTKPKNSKPFFNAGTERFVRDWPNTEVMVSVRDSREGENDALLGIVYLPLGKAFEKRSQVVEVYPLVGGIGFGRMRISMVFRNVELQIPKELLGWDYGTLEIRGAIRSRDGFPEDLKNHRIKARSNLARGKLAAKNGEWVPKNGKESVFLACRKRYTMPLVIEFRKSSIAKDSTPAFGVFWLKDIADNEEKSITINVWKGGNESLKKATTCAEYTGIDEAEQPLGEIEITICFWRGLSGYHKSYARKGKNGDMRDVMEVLDTVNDEIEDDGNEDSESDDSDESENEESAKNDAKNGVPIQQKPKHLNSHTNDSDTPSDSETSPEDGGSSSKSPLKKVKSKAKELLDSHNKSDDGSRGVMGQLRDYKDHRKQLHRKHRGLMQWKGMRSAEWAVDKVRHGKSRIGAVFEHQEMEEGVETEV